MDPQKRVQVAIEKTMGQTERTKMRPLQAKTFACMSRCAGDSESPQARVQDCMQRCNQPMLRAEQAVKQELKAFQTRLTRCAQTCQDRIRDQVPRNATLTAAQEEKFKAEGMACVNACVDDHIGILATINTRISEVIDQCTKAVPSGP